MKQKILSASSITALDIAVNAFIGRQTVDGRTVYREVIISQFTISGGVFYTSLIYKEEALSN